MWLARYLLGAAVAWVLYPVTAALAYLALVVFATITDAGLGGPLAGPFMILAAALLGVALTVAVLLPTVAIGELVARRTRWRWAPVVTLGGFTVALAVAALAWGTVSLVLAALSLIPLVAFATITHGSARAGTLILNRWRRHGDGFHSRSAGTQMI
ncbi:hypothetical protein HDA40_006403 [Hamadaea flava]|uniref:Uncharacterized protein n=1 Tax=Hamadaea flava TaxID=1742688 RepID=A0ABV8LVH0_9ACTN|nr:hypothetical protein [Hamadaea flava]MCP2327896.1 hypothetical protein [Hamadaea flava]